jgi:phage baseplate assembly protein W
MSFDLALERGDIKINRDGSMKTVFGNSKLRQDIMKILLTELGDNKFHPKYGSHIGSLKIGHVADAKLISLDLESSARTAIGNLISLQRTQSRRQGVTPGEIIIDILKVSVTRDQVDPRLYNIFVSVLTQKLTEVTSSVAVRIA